VPLIPREFGMRRIIAQGSRAGCATLLAADGERLPIRGLDGYNFQVSACAVRAVEHLWRQIGT